MKVKNISPMYRCSFNPCQSWIWSNYLYVGWGILQDHSVYNLQTSTISLISSFLCACVPVCIYLFSFLFVSSPFSTPLDKQLCHTTIHSISVQIDRLQTTRISSSAISKLCDNQTLIQLNWNDKQIKSSNLVAILCYSRWHSLKIEIKNSSIFRLNFVATKLYS